MADTTLLNLKRCSKGQNPSDKTAISKRSKGMVGGTASVHEPKVSIAFGWALDGGEAPILGRDLDTGGEVRTLAWDLFLADAAATCSTPCLLSVSNVEDTSFSGGEASDENKTVDTGVSSTARNAARIT